MIAPCMNCTKRELNCHSNCEEYQKFKKERAEINVVKIAESQYMNYLENTKKRMRGA